jgi:hypothetical protein
MAGSPSGGKSHMPFKGSLRPLLPHQIPAVEFVSHRDRAGIMLDKRLGKCTVAIRHVLMRGATRPLIVAPLSACGDWLNELESDGQKGVLLHGSGKYDTLMECVSLREPFFWLTNPEILFNSRGRTGKKEPELSELAQHIPYDAIIWDESTNLANVKSQTHKIAMQLQKGIRIKSILSGEYAPEGAWQIFGQMRWLNGGFFMGHTNFWHWRDEMYLQAGYDWFLRQGKMTAIRAAFQAKCFVLSRKDAGLANVITRRKFTCELPPKIRKAYDHVEKYFELPFDGGEEVETKYGVVTATWLAQMAGGFPPEYPNLQSRHKLDILMDLMRSEYKREKLVILFRFNAELEAVAEAFKKAHIRFEVLRGGIPVPKRRAIGKRFKTEFFHILGQVKVMRFGVDLSASDTIFRFSLPNPFQDISQPADRIQHPLKKTPIEIADVVCTDTVDEDRYAAMQEKGIDARFFMSRANENFKKRLREKLKNAVTSDVR